MKTHTLKTDPAVFADVLIGAKTFEIRFNDRDFRVGDVLRLLETEHDGADMKSGAPLIYTGREVTKTVSHILTGYGLADGWCCLSFAQDYCPNCQGSGEITVMTSHLGPDDYEHPAPCDHCGGSGTLEAGYLGVVKLLEKERAESLKLSGKLYGLRHYQSARDAFLMEVGEDMARWHDPIGYWKERTARTWMPVSGRLPAIGEPVWIAAWAWNNPGGTRIYGVAVYDGKAWGNPQDPEQSATWWPPTHWMPLTAAPAAIPSPA